MLGLVAAGRLVDTSPEMVDENKAMFTILQPENINHVVVFLTGEVPFEDGFGASIFLYWPSIDEEWQLLGHISNDKPSAIFRITGVKPTASGGASGAANPFQAYQMNYNEGEVNFAQIGVVVGPLQEIAGQTPATHAAALTVSDFVQFTSATVENFYNFLTSFTTPREEALRDAETEWVPLGALQRWHDVFLGKLEKDPSFWKRLHD